MWSRIFVVLTLMVVVRCIQPISHYGMAKLGRLAHLSSIQAQNLAWYQQIAANHLMFAAKNNLAETAEHASLAAHAILKSKQLVVRLLEDRLKQAERLLESKIEQYYQLQQVVLLLTQTAYEAQFQTAALQELLNEAKMNLQRVTLKDVREEGDISFGMGFH